MDVQDLEQTKSLLPSQILWLAVVPVYVLIRLIRDMSYSEISQLKRSFDWIATV